MLELNGPSPVKASDDLVGALNDTRSISRGIPDGESDQVALVFGACVQPEDREKLS